LRLLAASLAGPQPHAHRHQPAYVRTRYWTRGASTAIGAVNIRTHRTTQQPTTGSTGDRDGDSRRRSLLLQSLLHQQHQVTGGHVTTSLAHQPGLHLYQHHQQQQMRIQQLV
jgi:hypothetical protein